MNRTLIALAASCAVLAAVPAAAEEMSIQTSDLNLSTPEGQKILERRIDVAARKICGTDRTNTGTRLRSREADACFRDAKAAAQKRLSALVAERQLGG